MQERFFKALVIDDDSRRNKTYTDVLSQHFSVDIINDVTTIKRGTPLGYDLLVMDICLGELKTLTAFKFLNDHKWNLPIVMVSGAWLDEKGEPNDYILQVPNYKNILKVIGWNQFNKEKSNTQIGEEIYYEFCKFCNILCGKNQEKFVILHLSDLQFGGNVSGSACNDNSRIADHLKKNSLVPDTVVITGDIADKGKKSEFDEAQIWIETLVSELWGAEIIRSSDRKKILFVPGNHDYDLSACAADMFGFKFNSEEIDSFVERKKEERDFSIHQSNGFNNFIKFAARFSCDDSWFHYLNRVIHIEDYFAGYGINFIMMNSVYGINSRNCENRFDGFYCDLSDIQDDKLKDKNIGENAVNIIVMHNPPSDFKHGTDRGEKSWSKFQTIIEGNKVDICLYGHTHDALPPRRLEDSGGDYCEKMICIPAPSVRLAAASRTEDACRGFNVIEVVKNKSKYRKVVVNNYELRKATIERIRTKEFELE